MHGEPGKYEGIERKARLVAGQNLWTQILAQVRPDLDVETFDGWIRPIRLLDFRKNALHVLAPSTQHADHVREEWAAKFARAAEGVIGQGAKVVFEAPKGTPGKSPDRSGCPEIPEPAWYRWPRLYRDAVARCSESSDNYHYAGFLVASAAVLGKCVYTSMKDKLYPNLYVATVGRSGRGKGGATSEVFRLIKEVSPVVTEMLSVDSAEGLLSYIDRRVGTDERKQQSSLVIKLEELRRLIEKSAIKGLGSIIPALCQAYDSPDVLQTNTKTSFLEVRPPALTMFASTTIKALESLSEQDVEGGIGNRFMWIPGSRKPHPVSTPPPPEPKLWNELVQHLKTVVKFWSDRKQTEIRLTEGSEAWKIYDDYYGKLFYRQHSDALLETLSDRFRNHLRKIALIFSALDLEEETQPATMHAAIQFCEFLYEALEFNFRGYSRSNYAKDEAKLVEVVLAAEAQSIYRRELQRAFRWDGEYFKRRLQAVAGYPDDTAWDGPLRQALESRGKVLVSANLDPDEEGGGPKVA